MLPEGRNGADCEGQDSFWPFSATLRSGGFPDAFFNMALDRVLHLCVSEAILPSAGRAGVERVRREPAFRKALLCEAIDCMLSGDVKTGKAVLRDYINATVGSSELGEALAIPPKSLMRIGIEPRHVMLH